MFYEIEAQSHVRVSPDKFGSNTKKAILHRLNEDFKDYISKPLGVIVAVSEITNIKDGILIPGDGAAYYDTKYKLIVYKPEMQEVIQGEITEIADFGAFINLGPIDGMIHISQTMDDFVSYNKSGSLTGKESKKVLKAKDLCRARIIAVSYKNVSSPKIGLTMRQPSMGTLNWIDEEIKKQKTSEKKEKKKNGKKSM